MIVWLLAKKILFTSYFFTIHLLTYFHKLKKKSLPRKIIIIFRSKYQRLQSYATNVTQMMWVFTRVFPSPGNYCWWSHGTVQKSTNLAPHLPTWPYTACSNSMNNYKIIWISVSCIRLEISNVVKVYLIPHSTLWHIECQLYNLWLRNTCKYIYKTY